MTFRAARLLGLLKTAQICEDYTIAIDFEEMKAWTIIYDSASQPAKRVALRGYCGSIIATLDYLTQLEYIDYDYHTGRAHVTHLGWNATSATIRSAVQFTVRDIIIPLAVTIAATILLRYF